MSRTKKPSKVRHLGLRRRLAEIVEINRQIDIQLDRILKDNERAGWLIEKTTRKIK